MTNKLNLRSFLVLLPVSCLVSVSLSLDLQDTNQQNTTISTYEQQFNNVTELQPTAGPPQSIEIREEPSAAPPTSVQNTSETAYIQPSQGNGTSGNLFNVDSNEMNSTKHQSAGNESLAGTKSPSRTSFPEIKGSLDPVTSSSVSTLSSLVQENRTNTTNSAPIARTTGHRVTSKRSTSRTVAFISSTLNHMPTKPHTPQKTATNVCPTAEPKRKNLVGRCLIAIGSLAAIATIFIMTTIMLATKLAGSRNRHRVSLLHETEMVCISTLMSDSDHPVPTPRRPKSNGALIPITEDEDDDNLTLNSFLQDTEGVA